MTNRRSLAAGLSLALALTLACSDPDKVAAEAALRTGETTVQTLSDVTIRFAPEERDALSRRLEDARALVAKRDYKGALAAAQGIPEQARQVLAAANAKKEAVARWSEVSFTVSQMVETVKIRLAAVAQTRTLPAGVAQATVDEARAAAARIEADLEAARTQSRTGDFAGALAKATELEARAIATMKSLGLM